MKKHTSGLNSLQVKLLIFFMLGFLVLASALVYMGLSNFWRLQSIYNSRIEEETNVLKDKLSGASKLTKILATDYSVWDDPYEYLNGRLPSYAEDNLTDNVLETFESDAMWMFYSDGRLASKINITEDTEGEVNFEFNKQAINQLFESSPTVHFFIKTKTGIMEVYGSKVVPTDDPQQLNESPGYLLTGKLINSQILSEFKNAELVQIELQDSALGKKNSTLSFSEMRTLTAGTLIFGFGITDINGNDIGYVSATYQDRTVVALQRSDIALLILNITTYFVLLIIVIIVTWRWVIRPVNTIAYALEAEDSKTLESLAQTKTEFGKIAQLIDKFFEQEKLVKAETNETKKLLERLTASNTEIELTNNVMIGRELKMIELKKEVKLLQDQLKDKQ